MECSLVTHNRYSVHRCFICDQFTVAVGSQPTGAIGSRNSSCSDCL